MRKLNQKGAVDFMFVAVLVVLVAAAAFTLWRINAADETVSDTEANTSSESVLPGGNESEDSSEGEESARSDEWTSVTTGEGGITFSVPDGWMLLGGGDADLVFGDDITYAEGTPGSLELLESYGSDKPWRVVITLNSNEAEYDNSGYTESAYSIDGQEGTKYYRQFPSDYECDGLGCNMPGDTSYRYIVQASDTHDLYISYTVGESDTNDLEIFEEMLETIVLN